MQTCDTCKYAEFTMTKHKTPRINGIYVGYCKYVSNRLFIPGIIDVKELDLVLNPRDGHVIVPRHFPDGCMVWEKKD